MTAPLGASAFASLGAVPVAAPLGASAFASLGAVPVNAATQQSSAWNNPIAQFAVGAGDAIRNTGASVINFARSTPNSAQIQNASNMIGGMPLPPVSHPPPITPVNNSSGTNPTAYSVGNMAGNLGTYVAGGDIVEAGRAAAEALPGATGEIAQALGGTGSQAVAKRALGNAAYSGVTAPNNNAENAESGAEWSLGADLAPKALSSTIQYFNPNNYAKEIVSNLSGGQTLSGATQSVLSSIKNSYEAKKGAFRNAYTDFINSVPSGSIYSKLGADVAPKSSVPPYFTNVHDNYSSTFSPVSVPNASAAANTDLADTGTGFPPSGRVAISLGATPLNTEKVVGGVTTPQQTFSKIDSAYPQASQSSYANYTNSLKDLHNNFIENPTFSNAHFLQSELGATSRALDSPLAPPSIGQINEKRSIDSAQSALKSDMQNYLQKLGGNYADQYQNLTNSYRNEVVPYTTNSKIYQIAKGNLTNVQPSSLSTIFKAPEPDVSKVISDLPSGTADKILYTKLGQTVPTKSAQGLSNSYKNIEQQGLSEYLSPELSQQLGELNNRIKAKNALQMVLGTAAGATVGSHFGAPGIGAALGASAGFGANAIASPFLNYMGNRLPIEDIGHAVSSVLRGAYPVGRSALLANQLNNSGVPNGS